jgi:UDP-N-acetylglucosamine--N-acetylmuramyl-(pentapeptide) pyrophosphoryl-undecaprenol N-acetylglucosamine transferase
MVTGNPIRQDLAGSPGGSAGSLEEFGLSEGRKTFLVIGGSLGARTLNNSLLAGRDKLDREDVQVLWQCGRFYYPEVSEAVGKSGPDNFRVLDFISDMKKAYGLADVIVSRAGAITISELCVVGKPAILVPSPNVAEDHQTRNAEALVSAGAAEMVRDREAVDKLVDMMLSLIFDTDRQEKLALNIKKLALPDASERIAREALKLVEGA